MAAEPAAIQQQAERLHPLLADPELELPPRPGVEIDLGLVAESLRGPAAELGETLAAVADCQAAARHAKARRDDALERLRAQSGRVERFDRALRELTANRRIGTPVSLA